MANENKLQDIIKTSLESIRSMVDANTVIGNPINTNSGTTIIPISKVSVGYAQGGLDYTGKNEAANAAKVQNFGAGGGTGISVSPVGFLVVNASGDVDLINIGVNSANDPIDQLAGIIERSPEIFAKIKSVFSKPSVDDGGDEELRDE